MTRDVAELIRPSSILSRVPVTQVAKVGIDLKRNPLGSMNQFKAEGAILGNINALPHFKIVFPSKQYFTEEEGTHIMIIPEFDRAVSYRDIPERDMTLFFQEVIPHINDGKVLTFNESPNVTMPTAQTLGTLHFHLLDLPDKQNAPDEKAQSKSIIEPQSKGIDDLLNWWFSRKNFDLPAVFNAQIDKERIEKTGFPSGGIVFAFKEGDQISAQKLNNFIMGLIQSYRLLHDSLFSCIIDRIAYLATGNLKGEFMPPRLLPLNESLHEMEQYFFRHQDFPYSARLLFEDLRNQLHSITADKPDLVTSYTISVVKEENRLKVILDPHFNKKAGGLETFGNVLIRDTVEGVSLARRYERARQLTRQIGANVIQ